RREGVHRGRKYPRRHLQKEHGAQRRNAQDRGRSRDLRGDRRRRVADLRAGRGAAHGAALFLVLKAGCHAAGVRDQNCRQLERRDRHRRNDALHLSSWKGPAASMRHETQHKRLVRSGAMIRPPSPLPVGVGGGGAVGSGKTALMDALCKRLRDRYEIAAITNDIYTKWDAEYLVRSGALAPERIVGVETGGCPHTAIREDASINLAAVAQMQKKFPTLDLVLIESGGDNLAATFSPELADLTLYVIDDAAGDKIPSKGGPGITRSDLLVINKIDLAPHVGASLAVMERDAKRMRGTRPFVFSNLRAGEGVDTIARFIEDKGGLGR